MGKPTTTTFSKRCGMVGEMVSGLRLAQNALSLTEIIAKSHAWLMHYAKAGKNTTIIIV